MKIFSLKNLAILRMIFAALFLAAFTAIFSGLLFSRRFIVLSEWQFMPRILTAIALSGLITIGAMLTVAIITSMFGRLYCSWICPLGLLQDIVERLNHRFFMRKKRQYRPASPVLRVAFFVAAMAFMFGGFSVFMGFLEPYSVFGKISSGVVRKLYEWGNAATANAPQDEVYQTQAVALYLAISGGILLGIVVLTLFKGRIFCNTVCPTGSLLAGLSVCSARRLEIDQTLCVQCGKCVDRCNGNCINIAEKKIDFLNCFMCLDCMDSCPKNAINLVNRKKNKLAMADMPQNKERRNVLIAAGAAGVGAFAAGKLLNKTSMAKDGAIAPPGAGSIDRFISTCTGCGLCISSCKGGCLQPATSEYGWKGFMLPTVKFSGAQAGKCEFSCAKCSNICPTGALRPLTLEIKRRTRIGMAHFYPQSCLAVLDAKDCGACSEHCPTGALEMRPGSNGVSVPHVIPDLCIGCGNCEYACPIKPLAAIRVKGSSEQKLVKPPEEYHKEQPVVQAPEEIPF